jgi:hypothetical protein
MMAIASVSRSWMWVLVFGVALPGVAPGQAMHCDVLRTSDSAYAGRCTTNSRASALLILRPPRSGITGRWHGTGARVFGTVGDSTKDMVDWQAFSPVFVDVGTPDSLFSWCWCRVTRATVDTAGLHLDVDPRREAPATNQDLEVLRLVRTYFSDTTQWNRRDERSRGISYCARNARSRTLYCALYDASLRVRSEFYIFTPANGVVRDAINAAMPNNNYRHPLTDFNNDPQIDFAAMTRMLDDAVRRMRELLSRGRVGA